jgi:hypothetical protein
VIERCERACVLWCCHDFDMKQRAAIKYCFKLGKSASETYELLQKAYGSDSLSRSMTFVWFKRFREVRFQVLTAASMMFRAVFWVILPCKMIVDRRFERVGSR